MDLTHLYRSNSPQSLAGYITSSDSLSESSGDTLNSAVSSCHSKGYETDSEVDLDTETGRLSPHTTNLVKEQLELVHSEEERNERTYVDGIYATYGERIDYLVWNRESDQFIEAPKVEPGSSEDFDSQFGSSALIREQIEYTENKENEEQREIDNHLSVDREIIEQDVMEYGQT